MVVVMCFSCIVQKKRRYVALTTIPSCPTMTTNRLQLLSPTQELLNTTGADKWMVFDKAKEPFQFSLQGLYFERFTPDFEVEATVVADTAWYYNEK